MRPVFTQLIENEVTFLNNDDQKDFSLWAVLTTMVSEFSDEKTVAVPQLDRKYLFENKAIPNGWQVWIGKKDNSLDLNQYTHHRAGALINPVNNIVHRQHNCQCTLFVVMNLVIFTVKKPAFVEAFNFGSDIGHKMIQIH